MSSALDNLTNTKAPPLTTATEKPNIKGKGETIKGDGVVTPETIVEDQKTPAHKDPPAHNLTEPPKTTHKVKDNEPPTHPAPKLQKMLDAIIQGNTPEQAHKIAGLRAPHRNVYARLEEDLQCQKVLKHHGFNPTTGARGGSIPPPAQEDGPSVPEISDAPLSSEELESIIYRALRNDPSAAETKQLLDALAKIRPIERATEHAEADPCALADHLCRYAGQWCTKVSEQAELECYRSIVQFTGWTPARMAELSHLLAKGQQVTPPALNDVA